MATSIVATLCSHSDVHWIQVEGVAYQVVYEAIYLDGLHNNTIYFGAILIV